MSSLITRALETRQWQIGPTYGNVGIEIVPDPQNGYPPIAVVNRLGATRLGVLRAATTGRMDPWSKRHHDEQVADLLASLAPALKVAQIMAKAPELLQAVQLVLALHDHPDQQDPALCSVHLDPRAERQLRTVVAACLGEGK